ncbi:MAG: hypothetical protein GX024_00635 [Clostridiales bacterium]|nr:hypothetical protein [Clostridiales bacterium]
MGDNYVLLIIGIVFLSAVLWEIRKNKIEIIEMEKRLEEKETRLYEMYEAFENIMQYTLSEIEDDEMGINSTRITVAQVNGVSGSKLPDEQAVGLPDEQINEENKYSDYNNTRKAVLLMHKNGNTEEEIAKNLGIGIGEVRLILGLKR